MTDNAMLFTSLFPSCQFAICFPVCKFHTASKPSQEQVMICCPPGRCMTPLTLLVCPSNFWHGFVGLVSLIAVAGKDINIVLLGSRLTNPELRQSFVLLTISSLTRNVFRIWCWSRRLAQRVKVASNVGVVEWEASGALYTLSWCPRHQAQPAAPSACLLIRIRSCVKHATFTQSPAKRPPVWYAPSSISLLTSWPIALSMMRRESTSTTMQSRYIQPFRSQHKAIDIGHTEVNLEPQKEWHNGCIPVWTSLDESYDKHKRWC